MPSKAKVLRWRLEALAGHVLFGLFRALPVDLASALGGGLLKLVGPRLKVSNVARANLARAFPDMDKDRIEAIVAEVWDNLGRVAAEFPHLNWLVRNRVEVVNHQYLDLLRDDERPGLFISAHFGNWELAGATACRDGLPITLIYRSANNPFIEDIYTQARTAAAQGGQIPKGSQGARQAISVLANGGHIGMLVDQKMNDGIAVPFFGRDAMTAPAVGRFAAKFSCPVVPAKVERIKGANFRITLYPPMMPFEGDDPHAQTMDLMTRINALIEDWIRAAPGQWLWLHKRWPN